MILFPFTIARNNEIRNIENRILHHKLYILPVAKKRLLKTRPYSEALCTR